MAAFDGAWHERPPYTQVYHGARFWSHLAKNRTADHAAAITQMAMELFGGLGFLEEYAIARWHREALITPIWEGPANIQALDMLEAMARKQAHEAFAAETVKLLEAAGTQEAGMTRERLEATLGTLSGIRDREQAEWVSKNALQVLADAGSVAQLYALAESSGARYAKLAQLYALRFLAHEEYPAWAGQDPELFSLATESF